MRRTQITIDGELVQEVMGRYGLRAKREAVEYALRKVLRTSTREDVLSLRGIGWEGDLEQMRRTRAFE